jgi:hypothetical protein
MTAPRLATIGRIRLPDLGRTCLVEAVLICPTLHACVNNGVQVCMRDDPTDSHDLNAYVAVSSQAEHVTAQQARSLEPQRCPCPTVCKLHTLYAQLLKVWQPTAKRRKACVRESCAFQVEGT